MAAIDGKERDVEFRREFHLYKSKSFAIREQANVGGSHTVSATSFSVPGTTTTLIVGVSYDDHRDVAKSKAVVSLG